MYQSSLVRASEEWTEEIPVAIPPRRRNADGI